MNNEFEGIDDIEEIGGVSKKNLPNATAVLVLGILSIVTCWMWGIVGVILGIIALALYKKDKEIYLSNQSKYGDSYKNLNAGKICAIIGLSLSALFLIYMIVVLIAVAGSGFGSYYNRY